MNALTISLLIAGSALLVVWICIAWRFGTRESLGMMRLLLFSLFCVVPYAVLWFFYMSYYAILNKRPGGGLKPPDFKRGEHDA
jgi:hypothetical protein